MSAQSEEGRPEQQAPQARPQAQAERAKGARIESRNQQFLIASRDRAKEGALVDRVRQHPGVEVIKVLAEQDGAGPIAVVRMPSDHELLGHAAETRLFIESDHPLMAAAPLGLPQSLLRRDPAVTTILGQGFATTILVRGHNGQALEGAQIHLFGSTWAAHGVTGGDGKATLTLFGESPETVSGLYVRPRQGHWNRWVPDPRLAPDTVHTIEVKPLSERLPGFPAQAATGWGVKAMGLDQLPESWRGQGIRLAVIDSGIAKGHPQLTSVQQGRDFIGMDERGWAQDPLGHGTAVAGMLVAGGDSGLRGLVPEAELHVCKVFPGGRCSDLIAALDYCMDKDIDIATLPLGTEQPSELVEQRIRMAKRKGVAIIAAAGSSGDEVQYPACSPNVLAVAAMGKAGEYPEDSYHATWVAEEEVSAEGYFSPEFSCVGPEIDVCAPGVAVLSCQSPDGYAVLDGTSMAVPHVAALAAQILAHHPALRHAGRDGRRVESLFQIVKDNARPLAVGDPTYSGAGLPDAVHATGLEPGPVTAQAAPADAVAALRRILTILQPGAGVAVEAGAAGRAGLDQLHAAMQRAGLDERGIGEGVARGPAQVGGGPLTPRGEETPAAAIPSLHNLRMTMMLAGLSPPQ